MSVNRPWYKRYPSDFITGTMGLSLEEKGAYSLLLDLIYDKGGPIVDDARYLAGICNVSLRKWAAIRERLILIQKITVSNGFISNFRAEKEIESLVKLEQKLSESGAKGGRNRVENLAKQQRKIAENETSFNEINDLSQATLKHTCAKDIEIDIDYKSNTNVLPKKTKKACRLPEDFKPDFEISKKEGFSQEEAQRLFASFKDYWDAKSGKDATKLDWQATWRNWVRSEYNQKFKGNRNAGNRNNQQQQQSFADGFKSAIAEQFNLDGFSDDTGFKPESRTARQSLGLDSRTSFKATRKSENSSYSQSWKKIDV